MVDKKRKRADKFLTKVGNTIRERRVHFRLSQSQLAAKVGTTQAEISNLESGRINYTVRSLYGVLHALHLTAKIVRVKRKKVTE